MSSCVKQEANIIVRGIQSGFCLGGDFIIEFSPTQYDATWHSYRSVARKEFNKNIKVMEIQLGRKKPIDKGKEKLVLDLLNNYYSLFQQQNSSSSQKMSSSMIQLQQQQQRRFCESMIRFSWIIEQQTRLLRTVSELVDRNKIASSELGQLREQFLAEVKNSISNEVTKKNDFFFYSISTNNYSAAVVEKSSLGYSAKLMLLLARSLDNFEHQYLKTKSPEIFDQESMRELLTCQIFEKTTCECTIMTLDGIALRVKVNMQIQCHPGNQIFASKYGLSRELFKDSVVVFYFPQIEQHHLDLLYKTRKQQSSSSQLARNNGLPGMMVGSGWSNGQVQQRNSDCSVKIEQQSDQMNSKQIKGWGSSISTSQSNHSSYSKNNEILNKFYPSATIPLNSNNNNNTNSQQFEAELERIKLNTLAKHRRNIPQNNAKSQNTCKDTTKECINNDSNQQRPNSNKNEQIQDLKQETATVLNQMHSPNSQIEEEERSYCNELTAEGGDKDDEEVEEQQTQQIKEESDRLDEEEVEMDCRNSNVNNNNSNQKEALDSFSCNTNSDIYQSLNSNSSMHKSNLYYSQQREQLAEHANSNQNNQMIEEEDNSNFKPT